MSEERSEASQCCALLLVVLSVSVVSLLPMLSVNQISALVLLLQAKNDRNVCGSNVDEWPCMYDSVDVKQ